MPFPAMGKYWYNPSETGGVINTIISLSIIQLIDFDFWKLFTK